MKFLRKLFRRKELKADECRQATLDLILLYVNSLSTEDKGMATLLLNDIVDYDVTGKTFITIANNLTFDQMLAVQKSIEKLMPITKH